MSGDMKSKLQQPVDADLKRNIEAVEVILGKAVDLVVREFTPLSSSAPIGTLLYLDGMVNNQMIQSSIIEPLLLTHVQIRSVEDLEQRVLQHLAGHVVSNIEEAVDGILEGNTMLFLEGSTHALVLSTIGGEQRAIDEPVTESVIRGPRDGFTEQIRTNTALVRRRIRDPQFRLLEMKIGDKTKTTVNIVFIEGTVKKNLVNEIKSRLDKIKVDSILESSYIEELISDAPLSPFITTQATERPDKVAASLLEGRAAIFVDNTPFVILAPATFWQCLQASDDYYTNFYTGSFFRLVRLTALIISMMFSSIFVLVSSFHQELMPTSLALTIAAGREVVPFPVLIEVLIMELSFELMREAGLRLPRPFGSAVSIVGSLVIGQTAVQAGLVGTFAVIVVAVTGIASFVLPNYEMSVALRLARFPLLIASGTLGLLGFGGVIMIIILHMVSLRSFGEPYLAPVFPFRPGDQKDIFIRMPWWRMKNRPTFAQGDPSRQADHIKPSPPNQNKQ